MGEQWDTEPRALCDLTFFDRGVVSFLWGLGLGLFIWIGLLAVGVSGATAFIIGAVSGAGIFLFVRVFGEQA